MEESRIRHQASKHLYALLLKLRPRTAGDILPNAGQLAHAALLHWLGQVDPALATHLHEPNAERPFTCSSLWFPNEREVLAAQRTNRRLPILPSQTYWLRLTLLTDTLFRTLTGRFLQPATATRPVASLQARTGAEQRQQRTGARHATDGEGDAALAHDGLELPTMRLGGIIFDIAELIALPPEPTAPADGPSAWAGYATYDGLVTRARALNPVTDPAAHTVGLEFRSPTAFSDGQTAWGKRMHLFPDPERVFGRLVHAWNVWAPAELALDAEAVHAYARDWVVTAQFELRTHAFHFDRHAQVGFVGRCVYRLMDADLPPTRRAALAQQSRAAASEESRATRPRRGEEPLPPASLGADLSPAQALHLLSAFAFFCGIGQKTTMGMGQVRPLFASSVPPATTWTASASPFTAAPAVARNQEDRHVRASTK